jgi:hypothetical protein
MIHSCPDTVGTDTNCAILGVKNGVDEEIPVGYGAISRTLSIQERYLEVLFRLRTSDIAWSTRKQAYFDTFEVSVDLPPSQVTNKDRSALNCTAPETIAPGGHPEAAVPATGGLVFCGGGPSSKEPEVDWDSQWVTLRLDLGPYVDPDGDGVFPPTPVELYLTVWSREYEDPFYDDRAYYGTWVYVDKVSQTGEPAP